MQGIMDGARALLHTISAWLMSAWSDVVGLARLNVQHITPDALALIILMTAWTILCLTIFTRVRRRLLVPRRAALLQEGAALSGVLPFQAGSRAHAGDLGGDPQAVRIAAVSSGTRIETKNVTVLPGQEKSTTALMAHFKWQLVSSTPVNEPKMEYRNGAYTAVGVTTKCINLVFERDLNRANIERIKALENEYLAIVFPTIPGHGGVVALAGIGMLCGPFAILVWIICVFWALNINEEIQATQKHIEQLKQRQSAILAECDRL